MSKTNKTKRTESHKTCKCKYRLDASFCNNKQRWNEDKCGCKELIDIGILVIVIPNVMNHVT